VPRKVCNIMTQAMQDTRCHRYLAVVATVLALYTSQAYAAVWRMALMKFHHHSDRPREVKDYKGIQPAHIACPREIATGRTRGGV